MTSRTHYIDINCDVGEGVGNETQLLPLISSCNIACGGHAGDNDSMKKVATLAAINKVKVGAHPSYPDKNNFGRISMQLSDEALIESVQDQISAFKSILDESRITLHHIKPHGALYNDVAKNVKLATILLKIFEPYKSDVFLYVPYNSAIEKVAVTEGFAVKREAFADRNYQNDLSLVSRKSSNALLQDPKEVFEHIVCMVKNGYVKSIDDKKIQILADTFCVHGDTPSALQILNYLSKELPKSNIHIKK